MTLVKKLKCTKTLRALMFACIGSLITLSAPLSAHLLNETTAQVILRDGQVEVKVYTDLAHFSAALQSDQAWLLGDIDAVMPENLNASQQETFIINALKQKMFLMVNGKPLSVEVAYLGTIVDKNDADTREIIFQARHSYSKVTELSVSFHKSLGAVHTSFVKPQYKLLSVGETAHMVF
jgi:hypothetical protein